MSTWPAVTLSRNLVTAFVTATLSLAQSALARGPDAEAMAVAGAQKLYLSQVDYVYESRITRFLETTLPAGTYLVIAKGTMTSPAYGGCNIVSGPEISQTYHNGSEYDNNTKSQAQIMISKVVLATSANVAIRCGNGFGVAWSMSQPVLMAMPVASDKE